MITFSFYVCIFRQCVHWVFLYSALHIFLNVQVEQWRWGMLSRVYDFLYILSRGSQRRMSPYMWPCSFRCVLFFYTLIIIYWRVRFPFKFRWSRVNLKLFPSLFLSGYSDIVYPLFCSVTDPGGVGWGRPTPPPVHEYHRVPPKISRRPSSASALTPGYG